MATSEAASKGHPTSADITGDFDERIQSEAAARFAHIREYLARLGEGAIVPRNSRAAIREEFGRARDAVSSLEAKRLQIEVSEGRPLTLCFGRRVRRIAEMKQVVDTEGQCVDTDIAHTPAGDGCGVVFADSVSLQRPVFSRYCPNCRRKPGGRLRNQILARCVAACSGRVAVPGGWRLTCSGCRERFFATTPQRRRCDQCRH
jgi:hypothetical protein